MAAITSAQIDEEINKHLALVADLRTRKNSLLPICRLPHEILATIFTHGAREHYHKSSLDPPVFQIPSWVNVTYVCRHWRTVALNCPTLWIYHFTVSLRWTEELLARSKQASLKIYARYDPMVADLWSSRLVKRLLSHTERIQELRLRVPPSALPSRLSLRAPRLQILDITTWNLWTLKVDDENIPLLRTLQLTECPLPWHTLNLSRLTSLSLCCVPLQSQQNTTGFLTTLSHMQELTVLHLDRALASARGFLSSETDASSKINLPRLARLFIVAPLSTVAVLLSRVNYPSTTELRLELQEENGSSAEDYAQISSVLARKFSQSNGPSPSISIIDSLTIRFLASHSAFTLFAAKYNRWNDDVSMERPRWGSDIPIVISAGKQGTTGRNWARIASDICRSISPTDVDVLRVIDPPKPCDFWREILGHMHGLRLMKLSNGCMPDLVSLLTLTGREPVETLRGHSNHDPTPSHFFVPKLEELKLQYISSDSVSKESLSDALATRKAPCPRLTMIDCMMPKRVTLETDMDYDYDYDYSSSEHSNFSDDYH